MLRADHPDVAVSLSILSTNYAKAGDVKKAAALAVEALEVGRRARPPLPAAHMKKIEANAAMRQTEAT